MIGFLLAARRRREARLLAAVAELNKAGQPAYSNAIQNTAGYSTWSAHPFNDLDRMEDRGLIVGELEPTPQDRPRRRLYRVVSR